MKPEQIREWIRRLRAIDDSDAQALADEMEGSIRGPGRPRRAAEERVFQRARRKLVAEALYQGLFPEHLVPEGHRFRLGLAKGNRAEADDVAKYVLHVSVSSIRNARREPLVVGAVEDDRLAFLRLLVDESDSGK